MLAHNMQVFLCVLLNKDDKYESHTDQTMKVLVIHNPTPEDDPADVSIVIEGNQVLNSYGNQTKACVRSSEIGPKHVWNDPVFV